MTMIPASTAAMIGSKILATDCVPFVIGKGERDISIPAAFRDDAADHQGWLAGPTVNSLIVVSSGASMAKATTSAIRSGEIPYLA